MKTTLVTLSALGLLLLVVLSAVEAGKKSGGSKGGGFGGSSGGGGFKKGGKGLSKLKKAAVIGAAVYGGYQLGKLTSSFANFGHGGGWGFNDWNRWREVDGFMCRDSNDCNWIDRNLFCQDYELDFQPSALWFGGDFARIVGECACPSGMVWDDREMQCQVVQLGAVGVGAIIAIVIAVLVFMCCCLGVGVFVVRRFCR